jgi:hypothetical protein
MYGKYRDEHPADDAVETTAMAVSTIHRDDVLLSALGRGDRMTDDDAVAVMLAAWQTELDQPSPTVRAIPVPVPVPLPESSPRPSRGWSQPARALVATAATVAALAGAVTVAAGQARPGSPLWPITTVVYGARADSLLAQQDAERAISQARTAITDARYTEAARQLDTATALAGQVREQDVAHRLLDEIAVVRGLLPGATAFSSSATPTASATPGASRQHHGATPTPAPSSGDSPPLPVPTLPMSPPPAPTPTLPALPLSTRLTVPPLFP